MNKDVGCRGSAALWKWAAQNHHRVGDAERLRVGNDPHPRRDRSDVSAGPFATFACTT